MPDEARHKELIDHALLEELLGAPVIPTVAVTGEGISRLIERLPEASPGREPVRSKEERWAAIGSVIEKVQRVTHRHHTFLDKMEDASVDSFWGLVIGIAVIAASLAAIRLAGEGLIDGVLDPIVEKFWRPAVEWASAALGGEGFAHDIIVGRLFSGRIDFEQSFGLITTGLYVPVVMVLPYVLSFYAVLSFLEDFGYLPRLAVIFDALLHRMGLHGFAIVPSLLGLGCNVPGILATRVLDSKESDLSPPPLYHSHPLRRAPGHDHRRRGRSGHEVGGSCLRHALCLMAYPRKNPSCRSSGIQPGADR